MQTFFQFDLIAVKARDLKQNKLPKNQSSHLLRGALDLVGGTSRFSSLLLRRNPLLKTGQRGKLARDIKV